MEELLAQDYVRIPKQMIVELLRAENGLPALVDLPPTVRPAVENCSSKIRQIAETAGLRIDERVVTAVSASQGQRDRDDEENDVPEVNFDEDHQDNDDDDEEIEDSPAVVEQRGAKRRLVNRRTRRVQSKLRGRNPPRGISNSQQPASPDARETEGNRVQDADDAAVGNADQPTAGNRDLKYLLAQLRTCRGDAQKARSFLRYLSGCSFNAEQTPDGIIRFSDEEAVQLSAYVAAVNRHQGDVADLAEPRVVDKLRLALQQKFQLTLQQTAEVGKLLWAAMKAAPFQGEDQDEEDDDAENPRRRPQITELLDQRVNVGVSSSSMSEAMAVHRNLQEFPILAVSNEPISHLANKDVQRALKTLPDEIHRECHVGQEIHDAYLAQSAYEASVPEEGRFTAVSAPINVETVVVNDGDGIILGVDPASERPLQQASYTRLNRIDAPELFAVHYVRNEDTGEVLEQFKGHASLLGVQFFLDLFVRKGAAQFCYQLPRDGKREPKDCYGRPLKEYWFQFLTAPSERELGILDAVIQNCENLDAEEKSVLMSSFDPRLASAERPFYLSLNALLVVSGHSYVFTRFCHDKRMLKLQRIAKENQIGPLYCGLTRNHVIGVQVDTSEDVVLSRFASVDLDGLRLEGYPEWVNQGNRRVGLLPWHERALKKQVHTCTRQQAQQHLTAHYNASSPAHGCFIEVDRNSLRKQYLPLRTAEGHLQVRQSKCVGIGGQSTGDGLFTVKPIAAGTFICSYAPTAIVRRHNDRRSGDYLITVEGLGFPVDLDGAENQYETGLGRICNDGAFPFALLRSKFGRLVQERVNCVFAKRRGDVWIKAKRDIAANEELLLCYTDDLSYWKAIFSDQQLERMKEVLRQCPPTLRDAEEAIRALSI